MRKKARPSPQRRSLREIKPLNLLYKSDILALLRSVTMIIVWVFLFYCLGLSGKEDLIYMFNLNFIFKITERKQGPRLPFNKINT